MDIISKKEEMIFKNETDNKISYSIGISKKDMQGNYVNGYISVRFKKGNEPDEKQTKIKIKTAWLDFFKIEKRTIPFIFINEYEKVIQDATQQEQKENTMTQQQNYDIWNAGKDIVINDDELPFY